MVSGKRRNGKNRIALLIQYDGTMFNGWQIQDMGRTVQGEIEKSLKIITKEKIRVIASGRTDTGTHALGQVAHFDIEKEIDIKKICHGLNGILDRDISVKNIYKVPPDFHARFSAIRREYIYLIYNHCQRNPFMNSRAMWVKYKLDMNYLQKTLCYLVGKKDFASFCKMTSNDGKTVREIYKIEVSKLGDLVIIIIEGNAFLHNMIRIIVGTLVEMHKDKMYPEFIMDILERKNRIFSGNTAPACGLYLNRIEYKSPLSAMESAF